MSEGGDRDQIITVNIAGQVYKVKVRQREVRDRPYITVALHLNLNRTRDLEIAKFLEQLTQELKPRSGSELLKQIILDYKELRGKLIEETREFVIRPIWVHYGRTPTYRYIVKGPKMVLDALEKIRDILTEYGLTEHFKKILYELEKLKLIRIEK